MQNVERPGSAGGALRVLVVDDNEDAAGSLAPLVRAAGHQAEVAYDGPSALQAAAAVRPEVVLLDVGLPGLDGYEVAKRLRAQPALDGIVVIALTGYGQEADRKAALDAGCDQHLVKPVEFSAIREILAAAQAT